MKIVMIILLSLIPIWFFAQANEGVVIFEQKMNMHRRLGPESEQMKAHIPEYQTSKMQLLFSSAESLYKELEEMEDFQHESEGMRIQIRRPSAEIYHNFQEGKWVIQQEFLGKQFLIESEKKQPEWKMTGESKEILGYPSFKATLQDTANKRDIAAWFTTALPIPAGPESYGQLPGLILEVDVNDGEIRFTAQEVQLKKLEAGEIQPPKRGKKVTREEYDKMVEEKMKEMNSSGGGGMIRIIRQ
jgi:GLPGLI family protein